jgi:hypothetical protein
VIGAAAVVCSCSLLTSLDDLRDASSGDTGADDVIDVDASARCSKASLFGTPEFVPELHEQGGGEFAARLTGDEQDVFYTHIPTDGGPLRTYTAHRDSPTATFGAPLPLNVQGNGSNDSYPTVDRDGVVYYVQSDSTGSAGFGIFTASRGQRTAPFGSLQLVAALETPTFDGHPYVAPDDGELFFDRSPDGSAGPFTVMSAGITNGSFYDAAPVQGSVNDAMLTARTPVITADRLTLYFASNRSLDGGPTGLNVIWRASRSSPTTVFGSATMVQEIVSTDNIVPTWISEDECVIYFQRNIGSVSRIMRAQRSP